MVIKQVIEYEWGVWDLFAVGVARRPGDPTSIEMLSMTKLWQKKPIVSSVLVSFSIFRVQRFLLAFVNNIDDQGPPSIQYLPINLNV